MSKLEIRLLGRVEISKTDSVSQLELTRACQRLLAYLLLNPGKIYRRDVLMEAFWSDSSPERARSCLNSALWRLRRELEECGCAGTPYLLTADSNQVGFNWECDYWLDVQVFEQKLTPLLRKPATHMEPEEAQQLENLLLLYRGELLDGIFDDWTIVEREKVRLLYLNALTHLMNYHTNCNAFEKGMEFARAILKEDPLREDIHRSMMRLYVSMGQRALALQQYRICISILEKELGVSPMEETQSLYRQVIGQSTIQQSASLNGLHTYSDLEQHLQTVVRNLDQAYTLMRQAAQLMAHHMHVNTDA